MTTQEETIVWHSADEKPPKTDWYLTTYNMYEGSPQREIGELRWNGHEWFFDDYDKEYHVYKVIAWAHLPKGWQK